MTDQSDRGRLHYIGGSGIAGFLKALQTCGSSETFMAYLDKQFSSSFTGNDYTSIGNLCEDAIIEAYESSGQFIKVQVAETNQRRTIATIDHPTHPWTLVATPDIVLTNETVVEIKTKIDYKGTHPITAAHALQLIYYCCFLDKPLGSLVYYTPEDETIMLIIEYTCQLNEEQREFFRENLLRLCNMVAALQPGDQIPQYVHNMASVLFDFKRLVHAAAFSPITPLIVLSYPSAVDDLLRSCRTRRLRHQ